jgi:hypothetical protein
MAKAYRNIVFYENRYGDMNAKSFETLEAAIAFYRALRQRERYRPKIAEIYKDWSDYKGKLVFAYTTAYRKTELGELSYDKPVKAGVPMDIDTPTE